ncbi:MAG: bifunctional ADP-dependent NAD(P)H-hydrate dehydratase/NAD(P)H-hydrate epimerase [Treponema sp.]|nr:bifunctional ADP-dependent NAD(P)H-hydrate dehydratase/NAD(P)H-hydrate epimerase [Treponema sp.]
MKKNVYKNVNLVSAIKAQEIDREAALHWGLDTFTLVESAGRACADVFARSVFYRRKKELSFTVLAGSGNNAADALTMLKTLVFKGYAKASKCTVFLTKKPANEKNPLSQAVLLMQKIGIPVIIWEQEKSAELLKAADIIIDGIAGTGINTELRGAAAEMAAAANTANAGNGTIIVSIDIPSGIFDGWKTGMAAVSATVTLAVEPQKLCLYAPLARVHAGRILPVTGIFPAALCEKFSDARLIGWDAAAAAIPAVPAAAYKYQRGTVEIRAGSPGAAGAALLAAMGSQAAGAGLVRLIVDASLYPVIATACTGIMAVPDNLAPAEGRFTPDAVLLGPGWGKSQSRKSCLESYLPREKNSLPLILDADAVALAKDIVFHGNCILTPHAGEFAAFTGLDTETVLSNPIPMLRHFAMEKKATIVLKSHVMYAASVNGSIGIIDGMQPVLATGGTGDVLAGFCAAIAARCKAAPAPAMPFDAFACACAAASLLMQAAQAKDVSRRFADPAEIAQAAAGIAGIAWLR